MRKLSLILKNTGFTLPEIMISMAILSFLGVFVGQTITQGLKNKSKVTKKTEKIIAVRNAIYLIRRDLNLAFHDQDFLTKLHNSIEKDRQIETKPQTKTPTTPPPPRRFLKVQKNSFFIGDESSLSFTSLSHSPTPDQKNTSQQAQIFYYIAKCKNPFQKNSSSVDCLWRRVVTYLSEKPEEREGTSTVILENVKKFTLKYLKVGEEKWRTKWDSVVESRETSGIFPVAIEMDLESKGFIEKEKSFLVTRKAIFSVHFPNNEEIKLK